MSCIPHFTGRNVPIEEIAQVLNVPVDVIIIGIEYETLRFGTLIENEGKKYYVCPDKKVWEETGYFKEG